MNGVVYYALCIIFSLLIYTAIYFYYNGISDDSISDFKIQLGGISIGLLIVCVIVGVAHLSLWLANIIAPTQ